MATETTATAPPLDTPGAVRLLFSTLEQWIEGIELGVDLNDRDTRAVLLNDLHYMKQATDVLADRL